MKKLSLFVWVLFSLMPLSAMADTDKSYGELYLSVRRIGLELSKTQVGHPEEYSNSPVAALSATSQEFIKGVFDIALEYRRNRFHWDNSLFMEYGKTTLKPYNEPSTTDENADKILLSSDLTHACWEFGGFKFGPTVRAAYDTQFEDDPDAPRQNILRASGGLSLFDNPVIKSLYLTGVYEYDFTYAGHQTSKSAAELGWRVEYLVREGVKLSTNGYYREYLSYSQYVGTDLERDLSLVARMDTNLWGDFTMGPYVQYRLAKAREAENYGSNLMIGISFNYITKFGLITPPTE
ncbi:MAG: hypothetical protein NC311_06255 [Muribaculaceae bacterium]|nr:hypothetical protein [Muribaculaceae bacterium]